MILTDKGYKKIHETILTWNIGRSLIEKEFT